MMTGDSRYLTSSNVSDGAMAGLVSRAHTGAVQ